jgi:hypothetical protein
MLHLGVPAQELDEVASLHHCKFKLHTHSCHTHLLTAQELDEAARRRMPKQLYIPLPCGEARRQMVANALGPSSGVRSGLGEAELCKVVTHTEGYSGSDMKNLIQEACQVGVGEGRGGDRLAVP